MLHHQLVMLIFLKNCYACVSLYQNQLVDVCEKMQLQALRLEKFINQTLTAKEQKLQVRHQLLFQQL